MMYKNIILILLLSSVAISTNAELNMSQVGHLSYTQTLSDVWGYEHGEIEYALVGVYNGLSIVSLADPTNPQEVAFVEGPQTIWRDIKTFGNYAYVSNEETEGIAIVDLSNLPNSVESYNFYGSNNSYFSSAHNIFIDEFGFLYVMGANFSNQGAIIYNLNEDPINPPMVGNYDLQYCHDVFVRNNLMFTSEIYLGRFSIVDVSDKSNLQVLGSHETSGLFTHNAWSSDDNRYLFTTDEISAGFVDAYDISNPADIKFLDKIQSNPGSGVVPHNAHWINDFVVSSYYDDGIVIHDGRFPKILVEVGNFDTAPNNNLGCWGAYPYLSSGLVLATDRSNGLFVLESNYTPAAFLHGIVTNSENGDLLNSATITLSNGLTNQSELDGFYGFGLLEGLTTDIIATYPGFDPVTITDVQLINGEVLNIDIPMSPTGNVVVNLFDDQIGNLQAGTTAYSVDVAANDMQNCEPTYAIADYDDSVFDNVSIDANGVLTFDVLMTATLGTSIIGYSATCDANEYMANAYVFVDAFVGVDELTQNESILKVYPNPAHDIIIIEPSEIEKEELIIKIVNLNGQTVLTQSMPNDNRLSIESLESGLYLLELLSENKTISRAKLIKK